jgi:hypothetical protein
LPSNANEEGYGPHRAVETMIMRRRRRRRKEEKEEGGELKGGNVSIFV